MGAFVGVNGFTMSGVPTLGGQGLYVGRGEAEEKEAERGFLVSLRRQL